MAYNVGSLVTQIQRWAKGTTLDPTLVIEFLDDIHQDVLGKQFFSFMERTEEADLAENDTERPYPADLQSTERIWLIDPDNDKLIHEVVYKQPHDFFNLAPNYKEYDSNLPRWWTDFGRIIYWSTPLKKAYKYRNQYIKKPTPLTLTTDVPDIPEEFKSILLYGGLARVEAYRENFDISAVHDQRKEERLEDMALRYGPRQLGRPIIQTPWGQTEPHDTF